MADENQTLDSSPEEKAEAQAQEAESRDANTAESSDADTGEDANAEDSRESLLSVIQDVSKAEDTDEESAAESSTAEESEAETDSEEESSEEDADTEKEKGDADESSEDADDKDPPFHKHPRWKELVAERDQLKPDAENYQRINQFMDANRLTPQEVAEGFQTMALMKQDPVAAKQRLEHMLQGLQEFDPGYMPSDLQKEVDDGLITPERAQEMAQYRAQTRQAQFRNESTEAQLRQTQEQRQREVAQQQQRQLMEAVNAWEQQVKSKDPEYDQKAPYIEDRLRALVMQQGHPQTQQDAVKLAEQAKGDVEKRLKQLQPRKPESKPMPSGGSSKVKSEPKSLNEAISQAVGK